MSNLEQSIAEWRQRMLATGISAPALDELESHLREEVDRQMRSGFNERRAFEAAACQIGNGAELKKEFGKDKGLSGLLGEDKFARTERVLGVFWFVFCSVALYLVWCSRRVTPLRAELVLMLAIFGTGLWGSILLVRGLPIGRKVIRTISAGLAGIGLLLTFGIFFMFGSFDVTGAIFTSFYLVSAWLLSSSSFSKSRPAKK